MHIEIAAHAGFCFGVRRAVEIAERNAPAYTLGPIIHNPLVVERLKRAGVLPVDSPHEIPAGETVIIRSHGVTRQVSEQLSQTCGRTLDATCPHVKAIHDMVDAASRTGQPVIVVGDKTHPEVIGTLGWVSSAGYAVMDEADIEPLPDCDGALVVAQTTLIQAQFEYACELLSRRFVHLDIRRTICCATETRQTESAALAARVDRMYVIGGKNSSNTRKLYELCQSINPRTFFIEDAFALEIEDIKSSDFIGITAGASTPDCTFKEVVARMNDIENKVNLSEEPQETAGTPAESDFMADVEKTLVQIHPGQTITGTVVQITDDEVCVNVGYKADGLVKKSDLSATDVKIGDELEVEVVKVNDGEGNVLLTQKNIVNRKNWDEIVAKYEAGELVDGVGKEAVKGGLLANVLGIRTFIPASQLSLRYVEKIDEFVGQEMKLKIIELDKAKKRIVASRKAVLAAEESERKKEIWKTLEVGSIVKGTVRRIADFGAFVDIGGVDGLVHVTDLSWGRVKHPSDIVSVGDVIDVKIMNVDPEKERVSLSYKQTQPRPWSVAGEKYKVGEIVTGKVVRITTFGAFVELEPGLDGLVHISQCALTRIDKVEDALNVGDVIRVKILDVNTEAKRISLSVRQVLEDEALDNVGASSDITDEYAITPEAAAPAAEAEAPAAEAEAPAAEAEAPAAEAEAPAAEAEAPAAEAEAPAEDK